MENLSGLEQRREDPGVPSSPSDPPWLVNWKKVAPQGVKGWPKFAQIEGAQDRAHLLQDRLIRLMQLATFNANSSQPRTFDANAIQRCIDMLQDIFVPQDDSGGPLPLSPLSRFETIGESSRANKPFNPPDSEERGRKTARTITSRTYGDHALAVVLAAREGSQLLPSQLRQEEPLRTTSPGTRGRASRKIAKVDRKLKMAELDEGLKAINAGLMKYGNETREIHGYLREQHQRLLSENDKLKKENKMLLAYHTEDTVAREALHGTVRELQVYIDSWKARHDPVGQQKSSVSSRLLGKRKADTSAIEPLLDGIKSFMSGWKDAEDEFLSREKARGFKKDLRQSQITTTLSIGPVGNESDR
ncbi:uncharacterized protein BJX67DRAFT_178947 [Aspergillus lucknowensis]|uniref:Uncharacterized protein n=1 Tax=Aspergillus lucknowensis TaxID=176173 RepID=A0ABR4LLZ2_9EURO